MDVLTTTHERTSWRTLLARRVMLVAVSLTLVLTPAAASLGTQDGELKAAFLYRFASLTTWPESTFSSSDAPFRFGVVGDTDFAEALRSTVADRQIGGRRIGVESVDVGVAPACCQVLFVPEQHAGPTASWLRSAREGSVLTVSDASSFAKRGGIIQFKRDGRKIRFSINRDAAVESDLQISSKLLQLAVDVIDSKGQ